MKQVELQQKELEWIRSNIIVKFLTTGGKIQPTNTNLKNYEELNSAISLAVFDSMEEYSSPNLLRKLFYYSTQKTSSVFRVGFVDACYRFISDGRFDRTQYLVQLLIQKDLDPSHSHPALPNAENTPTPLQQKLLKRSSRFLGYGLMFALILMASLIISKLIDFRTLPWVISKPPHHTLWIAEYADGTKVHNRFRKYRTYDEVRTYFISESRSESNWGDCNSYMLDSEFAHIPVCFDKREAIEAFEEEHGGLVSIYKDQASAALHVSD